MTQGKILKCAHGTNGRRKQWSGGNRERKAAKLIKAGSTTNALWYAYIMGNPSHCVCKFMKLELVICALLVNNALCM